MATYQAKVIDGGRIVLPAPLRRRLALKTGDAVSIIDGDGRVELMTPRLALDRIRELVRPYKTDVSIVDELIADRRREAAAE